MEELEIENKNLEKPEIIEMFDLILNDWVSVNENIKEFTNSLECSDHEKIVPIIMFDQVFALYSSIKAHYKYGINETSLNVIFRSLFESCLNNAYLFLDDGTDYSKKLESYVYWACTKQKKNIK